MSDINHLHSPQRFTSIALAAFATFNHQHIHQLSSFSVSSSLIPNFIPLPLPLPAVMLSQISQPLSILSIVPSKHVAQASNPVLPKMFSLSFKLNIQLAISLFCTYPFPLQTIRGSTAPSVISIIDQVCISSEVDVLH